MGMIGFGSRMTKKKKKTGTVPVYLNVYDLTPINGYAYWFGLGVYHSGVQVHGVEYAYGAHERSTGGIFEVEPKHCPGFTFRKSITIGKTNLTPKEVRSLMEKLAERYSGNTYHLITKNCNHFCNDACLRLAGKSIPRWVNRLARLGFLCNCVLPASINKTTVQQGRLQRALQEEMENSPSDQTRFEKSFLPPPHRLSSSSQSDNTHSSSRYKHSKTPSSSMQTSSKSFTLRL